MIIHHPTLLWNPYARYRKAVVKKIYGRRYVLINRDIFDEYLEQFPQPPKTKGKAAPKISRWKK